MAAFYSCLQGKNSDCGIMVSGSADAVAAHQSSDVAEECSGKKKSKFQSFKNFFVKKKRKDTAAPSVESEVCLKPSQSSEDVTTPEATPVHTQKNMDSGSKLDVESKALSHDSVFTSDSPFSEKNEALEASQDSIHGKVKSLQLQLKQTIKLGSPQGLITMKKSDDGGVLSEDDGLPCSPPDYSPLHTVYSQISSGEVQRSSSLSLEGSDSDDDQISGASSIPGTPQVPTPLDFSQPASSVSCLDSSAAYHRIAVKEKACTKRKPASRVTRRQDLSEKVPLIDTEDKQKASRTCTEEDEDKDYTEPISEVQQDSEKSSSVLSQIEEDVFSQRVSTSAASVMTSEDEECVPDKDNIPKSEIPDFPWETLVTLEVQSDDFLLDVGCEVVSEDQGSLLMEVLSSLKGPLTSGLVLESKVAVEEMKMEDTTIKNAIVEDAVIEGIVDNVVDNQVMDGVTDPTLFLDKQILPDQNTLFETAIHQQALEELDYVLEKEDEPEEQEFSKEPQFEDFQVQECETKRELFECEKDQKEHSEEVNEDFETVKENICLGQEEKLLEDNMEKEDTSGDEEDTEKFVDHKEELVVEHNHEDTYASKIYEQEETEELEERNTDVQTCHLKDNERHEIKLDTNVETERLHEAEQPFRGIVSKEDLNQSEVPPAEESIEQLSFVVSTTLDLSSPQRISKPPNQPEEQLDILLKEATEMKEGCQEWSTESFPLVHEHQETEEQLCEKHDSSTTESQTGFTTTASCFRPPSEEVSQELPKEVLLSAEEDEPSSSNQTFDSSNTESSGSPVETQLIQPAPVQKEVCQAPEEAPENPFGVRLRKTPILHRYASEGENPSLATQTEPEEKQKTVFLELSRKPVLPKKADQLEDGAVKPRRSSDLAGGKTLVESPEAPSWISLAKHKQKIFKESSLDESSQEELSKKDVMPDLSSPITKDHLKPVASPVKVSCSLEISKPTLVEKDKRSVSHPTPSPPTQDEPPWLALAKKKAKAWSEMPQIVQ